MTLPALAVELQLHILNFVFDDSDNFFERSTVRNKLRRVCKVYNSEIDKSELRFSTEDAGAVMASLQAVDSSGVAVCLSVKRLVVRVSRDRHPRVAAYMNLGALIGLCVNVEEVGFDISNLGSEQFLDDLSGALSQLRSLKHFAISAPPAVPDSDYIGSFNGPGLLPRLPALKSLSMKNTAIQTAHAPSKTECAPFRDFTELESISYKLHCWKLRDLHHLFASFPPCLTRIDLDADIFNHRSTHAPQAIENLRRLTPQLKRISLLNEHRALPSTKPFPIPRGCRIDALVQRFTNARHLTIPTCAVTDWANTLAPLMNLLELDIVESEAGYAGDVTAADLVGALPLLTALERLSLSSIAWARWSQEEQKTFLETTTGYRIHFSLC